MTERINELIENHRYAEIKKELSELNEADVAAILEDLPIDEGVKIFRLLPKNIAADVFAYLPIEIEQEFITTLSVKEAANIIDNLDSDDATDLVEEMPANVVKRILANTDPETRRDINHLLKYPDDSAGSIMNVDFIALKENINVSQAIERIREIGIDKETINICYVLDIQRKLIGIISLRSLVFAKPDEKIGDIMESHVITVNTLTDQEEVGQMMQKYDFTAMPVVDSENRLVGIVTVDDIVDIIQQEATEDIEMMAAITPTDKPYMKTSVFETWKKRIPWLLLLMVSATFTSSIITSYENALTRFAVLTAFIPMFMDTGGNAGGQASVTIIRGLALNEIEFKDTLKIIGKEILVALMCGATLAVINFIKIIFIDARVNSSISVQVAFVVCVTLLVTVVCAKIIGCSLPILAKKIGFDPAVMASPFITTIVDALSLIIYFQFATHILSI